MTEDAKKRTQNHESFGERVLQVLGARGDDEFLRYVGADLGTEVLSYKDAMLQALVISSIFDRFNVPQGGVVVFVLSNPKDVFLAEMGALLTGRIPIISAHPSPKLSVNDFARTLLPVIRHAEPALIVGDRSFSSYLSAAIGQRVASLEDMVAPSQLPQISSQPKSPLFIQYSSGTTGLKKGVMITEAQLLAQIDIYAREIKLDDADHIVNWLPFYHDMGFITALMLPLLTGTPVTLMSPFDWVKAPLSLLQVITRDQGTLCWLPNFAYNFLVQHAKRQAPLELDLSSLRAVINCSEPIVAESHRLFLDMFKDHGLQDTAVAASYAMAETTFAITSGGIKGELKVDTVDRTSLSVGAQVMSGTDELVSSGTVISETDVRILGGDHTVLPDRHIGEIAVKSPSLMDGYFKNAELTEDSLSDGYFLTGDLGYRDGNDLFVTGRIKDLIITAGRNIYPQDIEQAVNSIPGVIPGRCVVFGVKDSAKGTENVVIIAESKVDNSGDRARLEQEISREVTAQFDIALADVMIFGNRWLVKSTSGKISRTQNRERYLKKKQEETVRIDAESDTVAGQIRRVVNSVTGKWVEDEVPLLTSGLVDSLTLTNLIIALEEDFSKRLPDPDKAGYDAYDSIKSIEKLVLSREEIAPAPFRLVIDRETKLNYLHEGPKDFDALILGSSRSYMLRTEQCRKFGFNAFQFSVAGVRPEEFYCMVQAFQDINKKPLKAIVIGTDPTHFAPHLPIDLRFYMTRQLVKYLEPIDQDGRGDLALDDDAPRRDAVSTKLSRRIEMRYGALDVDLVFDTATGDVKRLYGHDISAMAPLEYEFDAAKLAQQIVTAKACDILHPRRLYYFSKILEIAQMNEIQVLVYTNPLHPGLVEMLEEQTSYYDVQTELVNWVEKQGGSNVIVRELRTPSDFSGLDNDYYDGSHMGGQNGDLLMNYLLKPFR